MGYLGGSTSKGVLWRVSRKGCSLDGGPFYGASVSANSVPLGGGSLEGIP
jgi:hypothetical protein